MFWHNAWLMKKLHSSKWNSRAQYHRVTHYEMLFFKELTLIYQTLVLFLNPYTYTDGHVISHSWFLEKRFDRFDHVSIGVQKQTISHLKALIKCFKNQGWNWVLHPYKSCHALETKKHHFQKHRVKVMLGLKFNQFWVCNQSELIWDF